MKKLQNKVAVLTGASSGIGLATAKLFVEEGAYVYITGRRQSELDKAKEEIGENVSAIQGDISNLADLDKLFSQIKSEKGSFDILAACAGYIGKAATWNVTPKHFDKTFNVNVRGTFFTVQKALPIMNEDGTIVILTSGLWKKGFPDFPAYATTVEP